MVLNHTASLFCINILRANLDLPVPVKLSRVYRVFPQDQSKSLDQVRRDGLAGLQNWSTLVHWSFRFDRPTYPVLTAGHPTVLAQASKWWVAVWGLLYSVSLKIMTSSPLAFSTGWSGTCYVLLPNKPGLKNIFTRGTDRLMQHSTQIQAPPQICSPKAKPLGFHAS